MSESDQLVESSMAEEIPVCEHFQQAAELLGKRWTPQIVRALLAGSSRFTQVRDAVPGLSDNLLSERLKALEGAGIVTRSVAPSTPVRICYELTAKGRDLERAIGELADWAERWARRTERRARRTATR